MEFLGTVLSGSVGAGLMAIVMAALQRHWKKKDDRDGSIKALVAAQKVIMTDRVRYLGGKYLERGEITLEDKETLQEMYGAYKALGGNGHLETVMREVDRLPVSANDRQMTGK